MRVCAALLGALLACAGCVSTVVEPGPGISEADRDSAVSAVSGDWHAVSSIDGENFDIEIRFSDVALGVSVGDESEQRAPWTPVSFDGHAMTILVFHEDYIARRTLVVEEDTFTIDLFGHARFRRQ